MSTPVACTTHKPFPGSFLSFQNAPTNHYKTIQHQKMTQKPVGKPIKTFEKPYQNPTKTKKNLPKSFKKKQEKPTKILPPLGENPQTPQTPLNAGHLALAVHVSFPRLTGRSPANDQTHAAVAVLGRFYQRLAGFELPSLGRFF